MSAIDIISVARKAGIKNDCDGIWCNADQLARFAKLVAEAEREECAKMCENDHDLIADSLDGYEMAAAIRARGKE
jgi:hypothetical protein